ncbi:prepilin-type N-terminal cleavage/methylation domain-containing protein [Sporolactobacillus terrae]|uniref:prepilin-type N-terminal cleavage/methylation domain-containing protein n=1 Tax=Sporolactobacillus terrae TaxID=269673 RepID=UPI0006844668|nr:prepilin-type N-terminal cleavage/methylation domain-containing protein [Sporolactobacillus terrae]
MLKKIMKKANEKKNQKGFTLIELLAVIVILAILAAIAIPSVVSIINKQNDKAKVQDALTAIHAAKLYVADHTSTSTTTFGPSQLDDYLDKSVKSSLPNDYSITYADGEYTITDTSLPETFSEHKATENQLLAYNKGDSSSKSSESSSTSEPTEE